jgi:hypothetical protein
MIFLPDDSPLNVDKDKVPDMPIMEALEVIRQSAGDITFSKNSLIEDIKGDVRVACNKEWVEWVVANAEVEGDTIILPGKLWRERRKEIGL